MRLVTFAAIVAIYLALPNVYPRFMSPNELSRLRLTRALVEHRSFQIDPYIVNPSPRTVSDVAYYRGHFYSDKAAGMSLAAVPVVAALRLVAPDASLVTMLLTVRFCVVVVPAMVVLWFLLKRCRTSYAFLSVIGLFLGSVVITQTLNFSGHVLATIVICCAAVLAGRGQPSDTRIAMSGLFAGAATLIDFTSAIAAAGLLIVVSVRARFLKKPALFAVSCAAIASVQLLVNALCFDGPFDFAYHHMFNPADQANRGAGFFGLAVPRLDAITGLTVGGLKGMFVHSPFLILSVPALFFVARRRRDPLALWAVAMCFAYFWVNASLKDWEGGWSLGPRYLLVIYPLLVYLFVQWVEDEATERSRKFLYAALVSTVAWSVLLHLTAMVTWPMPPNSTFFSFPALEIPAFLLFQNAFAPNVLEWMGVPALIAASIVVLLGLAVIIVTGGLRSVPYVLIVTLLFTMVIARAAPQDGERIRRFHVFLRYMGS